MTTQRCDGCGKRVRIAGGIGDFWSFSGEPTQGITLELADGSEYFLCFDCLERLPEDREPTAEDVEALPSQGERTREETQEEEVDGA